MKHLYLTILAVIIAIAGSGQTITGTLSMCDPGTTTLSGSPGGGTWASSASAVAVIDSATGICWAIAPGTTTITYHSSSGDATAVVTVNPTPSIGGPFTICQGLTAAMESYTTGATWTSSDPAVVDIGASTGVFTALAPGTATISYTTALGCSSWHPITVNPAPATITGPEYICIGSSGTQACTTPGGTWSSSNTTVASIGTSTGVVTALAPGTTNITYTLGTGCIATRTVTITPVPPPLTGPTTVCVGSSATLTCGMIGGTWTSAIASIATIGSGTGIATGVSPGTVIITYALPMTSCASVRVLTVTPAPMPITGVAVVCAGASTSLTCATPGGTWSLDGATVATIAWATGVATGIVGGTSNISYTVSATGCSSTRILTVNPIMPITGPDYICVGSGGAQSCATPGGTWSSSNTFVASIGATTGVITSATPGTSTISYTLSTGCYTTRVVTINSLPAPITGVAVVCAGASTSLSSATPGGTWSSGNSGIATITWATGVATGIIGGTSNISYTVTATGCSSTRILTVTPAPMPITGPGEVCEGTQVTLSCMTAGGTWTSSSTTGIATINPTTGITTGVAAGVVNITYTIGSGCSSTRSLTVNPLPAPITGPGTVCVGSSVTLSSMTTGSTWSISNPAIASILPGGCVTGVAPGTAIITYTAPNGCYVIRSSSVNPLPTAIGGVLSICPGTTTTLTDATAGGTWSNGAPSIATIGSGNGIAIGLTTGATVITYTISSTGCYRTAILTVNALPAAITGTATVCEGLATTLMNATPGGTWTSSAPGVAIVGSATGIVVGVTSGVTTITYTLGTGCRTTMSLTVTPLPSAITGVLAVGPGTTTTLSSTPPGGSWSSGTITVATIGAATGVATGVSAGLTQITYTIGTGCIRTAMLTVNPLPAAITGPSEVCAGSDVTLSCTTPGGTWTSSNTSIATIGSTTGLVTGLVPGTATITYTIVSTGTYATRTFTVSPVPAAITGPGTVCVGSSITITSATPGGTWSTSNPAIATIGTAGLTGVAPGVVTVTYTLGTGCYTTRSFTVNALPAAISGASAFCNLTTTTLSDATPGGTWSSSDPTIADFPSPIFGALTPTSVGTVTVTYTLPTGCVATKNETIILAPYPITGPSEVCAGSCTTLNNIITGGSWSSSSPAIAPITTPGGVLCGVTAGTTIISYELSNGCYSMQTVTVNTTPAAIVGASAICDGTTTSMTCVTGGGSWSSSMPIIATIDAAGVVAPIVSGVTTISYTTAAGCSSTKSLTVNPIPGWIMGVPMACEGLTTSLSSSTPGGTWFSSDPAIASIGTTTGVVMGNSAGVVYITYTLGTGCFATTEVTINPLPAPITGPASVCDGGTVTESCASFGGIWSISDLSIASIIDLSGEVTGNDAGVVTLSYMLPTGCVSTRSFTVNPLPAAITGPGGVCDGSSVTESCATPGGVWTSSNTVIASAGLTTGVITGLASGVVTITYTLATGCISTRSVTVNAVPAAITGPSTICEGSTMALACSTGGGIWSSSTITVATVGLSSGIVTAILGTGTTTITYTIPSGCISTKTITVNTLPAAITGTSAICLSGTETMSCTTPGGTWSSSIPSVATIVSGTGAVTPVGAGTTTISYTLGGGCSTTMIITINPTPGITGSTSFCVGGTTTLSSSPVGGTWSSSTITITVGATTGEVSATAAGTSTITYAMPTGCAATTIVTATAVPTIGATTTPPSCGEAYTCVATGASSYTWVPGAGISYGMTMDTAFINPAATTTYTVTGTSAGCSSTTTFTITADRIIGHLSFGGPAPSATDALVWLIQYDPSDSSITAMDSVMTCLDGGAPFYEFDGKPAGSYLVKAKLLSSVPGTSDYLPTYGGSAATWDLATPITHTTSTTDSQHIAMLYGLVPSGPGFISGYVYMGAGKGTSGEVPVSHMVIYLKNTAGQVLTFTYTDAGGAYSFSGLAAGSYVIYPEEMSYYTTAYPVTVSAGVPADGVGFKKRTTTGIIEPWTLPNSVAATTKAGIAVYPNPATDVITLENAKGTQVTIYNVTGRKVLTTSVTNNSTDIDISQLASGVYFIEAGVERFKIVKAQR